MTREEWYSNTENRDGLLKALSNPFITQALTILKEEAEPRASSLTESNVTVAVSRMHSAAGYFQALRDLEKLAHKQTREKKEPVLPRSLIDEVIESIQPK